MLTRRGFGSALAGLGLGALAASAAGCDDGGEIPAEIKTEAEEARRQSMEAMKNMQKKGGGRKRP